MVLLGMFYVTSLNISIWKQTIEQNQNNCTSVTWETLYNNFFHT